ncbi:MAG: choice-of-anchor D domain-containing protein [Planctomycetes bacterium]|nr:choice-of-anchor D domain-containing protein [Planctomycetota bacterium]
MRLWLLIMLLASPLSAQVYTSSSGLTPIPNNAPGIRDDIIVVGAPASIQSMRVRFTIHHPNDNDLGIWLVPPGVTVSPPYNAATMASSSAIPLSYLQGGSGDDYLDAAFTGSDPCFYPTSSIWGSSTAPFDKLYGAGQLNNFYGTNANGTWGLVVYDQGVGNVGDLVTWSLEFAGAGINVFQRPLVNQIWTLRQGQPNAVMRFDLAAPTAQTVQSLTISRLGTGADTDISNVSLWIDLNHDGYADFSTEPQLGTTQTFSGGDAVFSGLGFNLNQGWISIVVVASAATGGAGNEFGAQLSAVSVLPGTVFSVLPIDGPIARIQDYAATFPANENFDGQISANVGGLDAQGTPAPSAPSVDAAPASTMVYTPGRVRSLPNTYGSAAPHSAPNHVALDRGIGALEFRYDLSAYSPANDAFGFQFRWASTGASPSDETGVFASDDGGATWFACLYRFPLTQGTSSAYEPCIIDLSAAVVHSGKSAFTSQMVVRIQHRATGSVYTRGLLIDSVTMKHATSSVRVSAGAATTVVNSSDGVGELDFGPQDVNAGPSSALTISVKNVGSVPVALGTPTTTGGGFSLNTSGFLGTLAANATTTFSIQFDPSSLGSFSSTISMTHSASDVTTSPFVFVVRGTGVASPPFEIRETTTSGTLVGYGATASGVRAFGTVTVGSSSLITTLHIINTSSSSIIFGAPTLTGGSPAAFLLDTTGFVSVLTPAATTSFTVQFQPTNAGLQYAQVSFSHTATQTGSPPDPWVCSVSGIGSTPPSISVTAAGSQSISNGDAASGATNFGAQLVHAGPSGALAISIGNSGTQTMNLGTPALFGSNPGEFSIDLSGFNAVVAGGSSTSFAISFDPTMAGSMSAVVSFGHDATNSSTPFSFDIAGNGVTAPALEVRESGAAGSVMADGTSAVGPFLFGERELSAGQSSGGVCYITNLGSDDLVLGMPSLSGSGAADFAVNTSGYQTTVTPGNSTSFQVAFDPSSVGLRVATVSFTHNDTATTTASFSFQVAGNGFAGPWLRVREDNVAGATIPSGAPTGFGSFGSQDISVGATSTKTVWIQNDGTANLILGALTLDEFPSAALNLNTTGFQNTIAPGSGTSFTVAFDPSLVAAYTCFLRFTHNSGGAQSSPFSIRFSGTGTSAQNHPLIEVREVSTTGGVIQNGSAPFAARNFGQLGVGSTSNPLEIHLLNTGTSNMALGTPALTGSSSSDFVVDLTGYSTTLTTGSTTSFSLQFQPTLVGIRDALVTFTHDGLNTSSPFTFSVAGSGASVAIIEVHENSASGPIIPDGSSQAVGARDFGLFDINAGPSQPLTVVIRNTGSVNMNLGSPSFLSGGSEFGLNSTGFLNSVPPAGTTSFEVFFDPTTIGAHTGLVKFTHDALPPGQSGITNYSFVVGGYGTNGPVPVLELHEATVGGAQVAYGSAPSAFRDFGSFDINSGPTAYKTFVIVNVGGSALTLGPPTLPFVSGYNQNAYVLDASGMAGTLQPSQSTSFSVAFDPNQVGQLTGLVRMSHNAGISVTSPFEFELTGTGTGTPSQPSIQLREINLGGPIVPNGAPAVGTNRDFGVLLVGNGPGSPLTLVIKNWGTSDLVVGTPTLTGSSAGDFVLNLNNYTTVVAAGSETSLTVSFDPQSVGNKAATISIPHNAGIVTASPFACEVIGTALAPSVTLEVRENNAGGALISNLESATGTARDFGSLATGVGASTPLTIYITNTGTIAMTIGTPTITGADASEFVLDVAGYSMNLAPGTSTSFVLYFAPQSVGAKQAGVEFTHNATNTATPFVFELKGNATNGESGKENDGDESTCSSGERSTSSIGLAVLLFLTIACLRLAKSFARLVPTENSVRPTSRRS